MDGPAPSNGVCTGVGRKALKKCFRGEITASRPFGVWVVERNGKVVGFYSLLDYDRNPAMRRVVGELAVYVAPVCHHQGIAESLVRHSMVMAARGLRHVIGFISKRNQASTALAAKCGWTTIGEIPAPSDAGPVIVVAYSPIQRGVGRGGRRG